MLFYHSRLLELIPYGVVIHTRDLLQSPGCVATVDHSPLINFICRVNTFLFSAWFYAAVTIMIVRISHDGAF